MHFVAFLLLIVGGLNWLLVGIFGWDISSVLGGMESWPSRIIYILVGLAAVYELLTHRKSCIPCKPKAKAEMPSAPTEGQM
ncbi:MAG: DUF378 domain-containing protein [Candidatus Harrisonbacteria bacterium CG10_big_fil_rev_8_21_14_0_10_45_28]|uniref:DUF378 domain-containing protein n=1 Tax=Candidatus Harrisonbacteria bacterium CG10_big_fil_rev_8_21_14_0_10_45_28 TaxID=1974586 RepID=A0A2H0UN78_9BACT|nr:MAG: DUF378 domain-containing protein [Candidatus Harrisonbacteria bacterium CG10_big_fil_rev_8_21_14_0_10_45_28]